MHSSTIRSILYEAHFTITEPSTQELVKALTKEAMVEDNLEAQDSLAILLNRFGLWLPEETIRYMAAELNMPDDSDAGMLADCLWKRSSEAGSLIGTLNLRQEASIKEYCSKHSMTSTPKGFKDLMADDIDYMYHNTKRLIREFQEATEYVFPAGSIRVSEKLVEALSGEDANVSYLLNHTQLLLDVQYAVDFLKAIYHQPC